MPGQLGKMLVFVGAMIAAFGAALWIWEWAGLPWLGRLPGDFRFRVGNTTIYIPLATCLLLSAALTLVLLVVSRFRR